MSKNLTNKYDGNDVKGLEKIIESLEKESIKEDYDSEDLNDGDYFYDLVLDWLEEDGLVVE